MTNELHCVCHLKRLIYYNGNNNFGIASMALDRVIKGEPPDMPYFTMKGTMSKLIEGIQYEVNLILVDDPKYGQQYNVITIKSAMDLSSKNPENQRKYLEQLFSEGQVANMYDAIDDPFEALRTKDFAKLVQVHGCGMKTARLWIERFSKSYDVMKLITELADYQLTPNMIRKIYEYYTDVDLAIQRIKENPYCLIDLSGVGWATCDRIALNGGISRTDEKRVRYFIKYYLQERAVEGYSYIPLDYLSTEQLLEQGKRYNKMDLMAAIDKYCGSDTSDDTIVQALQNLQKELWFSKDRKFIGLLKYYNLERNIAEELIRIRNAPAQVPDSWQDQIAVLEKELGFEYSEEQYNAIQKALENNVIVITGNAGTGKSTVVKGILSVLSGKSFAQTCLAGRAAARLSELTGEEGYTIHRLLGYQNGKFTVNKNCPLSQEIIILDEISMVDGDLFYSLIQAIQSGSKLIMLGDVGQLESIGCLNIAADLIRSKEIVSVELTQIHRQAAKSAIITESHKVRRNIQLIPAGWAGTETRGELQDLSFDCYSDSANTYYRVLQHFQRHYEEVKNIMDVQVLLPVKDKQSGTAAVNAAIQSIYNPKTPQKKEIETVDEVNYPSVLREGDKVINTENNYHAILWKGKWAYEMDEEEAETTAIYNGSMGEILQIFPEAKEILIRFIGIGDVLITNKDISKIKLGYAISVHKFQGSQTCRVIFGLDFYSYALLTKELVYTAMTRATEKCDIVAQNSALRKAVATSSVSNKLTHLTYLLYDIAHPNTTF